MNVAPEPARLATHTVKVTRKMSQRQVHRLFAAGVFIKGVNGRLARPVEKFLMKIVSGMRVEADLGRCTTAPTQNQAYDSVFSGETVGHHSWISRGTRFAVQVIATKLKRTDIRSY